MLQVICNQCLLKNSDKYHTVGTVPTSNINIVEVAVESISLTCPQPSLSWLGAQPLRKFCVYATYMGPNPPLFSTSVVYAK